MTAGLNSMQYSVFIFIPFKPMTEIAFWFPALLGLSAGRREREFVKAQSGSLTSPV